jgi:ribulose 1,5-bisphosphate synthetase/thiazole synthase
VGVIVPAANRLGWDEVFDVVVVGSGGGALTAALLARDGGASVLVIEKDEFIGGTTAVSGGDMWVRRPARRRARLRRIRVEQGDGQDLHRLRRPADVTVDEHR